MRNIFEGLAKYALLRGILYIALGILLLIAPQSVMSVIVYVLAGYAIVMGVINIVGALRQRQGSLFTFDFVMGVLLIVLGLILILFRVAIFSILPIFLGVLLIIAGASRLAEAFGSGAPAGGGRTALIIFGALITLGGILIVANPFSTAALLFRVFGVLLIVQGVGELTSYKTFKDAGNQP